MATPDAPHGGPAYAPYRSARLATAPVHRRRGAGLVAVVGLVLGAIVASSSARLRPHERRPPPVGDRPIPGTSIEHATALVGGEDRVFIATRLADGGTEVLAFPGEDARRAGDAVAVPRRYPVRRVWRVAPGGIVMDDRSALHELGRDGRVTRVELPADVVHGRVVDVVPAARQSGAPLVARTADGAVQYLARDRRWVALAEPSRALQVTGTRLVVCVLLAEGRVRCWDRTALAAHAAGAAEPPSRAGADVPALALPGAVELAVGPPTPHDTSLACVRDPRGRVACAWIALGDPATARVVGGPVALGGDVPPARGLAVGARDLCLLGRDGGVRCAWGPERDPPAHLAPAALALRRAPLLEGAAELALMRHGGCARWPAGAVRCWGPFVRGGAVLARAAPVVMPDLDRAERLLVRDDAWCAEQRGALVCRWRAVRDPRRASGAWTDDGRPWREAAAAWDVCAPFDGSHGARRVCARPWRHAVVLTAGDHGRRPAPRLGAATAAGDGFCARDAAARAWCAFGAGALARAPAFDGYDGVAALGPHACAWRVGAPLRCLRRAGDAGPSPLAGTRGVVSALQDGCVLLRDGGLRCLAAADDGVVASAPLPPQLVAALGGAVQAGDGSRVRFCVVGANGRVACQTDRAAGARGAAALVPGLAHVAEVFVEDLACARRADGRVLCWGANSANALTSAEAARRGSFRSGAEASSRGTWVDQPPHHRVVDRAASAAGRRLPLRTPHAPERA